MEHGNRGRQSVRLSTPSERGKRGNLYRGIRPAACSGRNELRGLCSHLGPSPRRCWEVTGRRGKPAGCVSHASPSHGGESFCSRAGWRSACASSPCARPFHPGTVSLPGEGCWRRTRLFPRFPLASPQTGSRGSEFPRLARGVTSGRGQVPLQDPQSHVLEGTRLPTLQPERPVSPANRSAVHTSTEAHSPDAPLMD